VILKTRTVRAEVPAALLTCAPSPPVPAEPCDQACVSQYMARTWFAGDDCRRKLSAVSEYVAPAAPPE
jgi:hypothetical protein